MHSLAIIGGGIHGSMLFVNLPEKLQRRTVIIDVHAEPLARFTWQCRAVGVSYLRSPGSHSLHRDFRDLFHYARTYGFGSSHFVGRYLTPSLDLFTAHAHALLEQCNIQNHWVQGRVNGISRHGKSWTIGYTKRDKAKGYVQTQARRVILALGQDDAHIPVAFAGGLEPQNHVLHELFEEPKPQSSVCVIGGGMSGTQCALRLVKTGQYDVTLISGHPHSVTYFDSNPCFIGPRCLPTFLRLNSYQERAGLLKQHRYRGSINPAVFKELEEIQSNARLSQRFAIVQARVVAVRTCGKNAGAGKTQYEISLANGARHFYDAVICATGINTPVTALEHDENDIMPVYTNTKVGGFFMRGDELNVKNKSYPTLPKHVAPHQEIIEPLIYGYDLPRAAGNFPIVNPQLEWHDGLFVSGALAELEIGPAARNIIGAHLTYRRLKQVWHNWE